MKRILLILIALQVLAALARFSCEAEKDGKYSCVAVVETAEEATVLQEAPATDSAGPTMDAATGVSIATGVISAAADPSVRKIGSAMTTLGTTAMTLGGPAGVAIGGAMAIAGIFMSIFGGSTGPSEELVAIQKIGQELRRLEGKVDQVLRNQEMMNQKLNNLAWGDYIHRELYFQNFKTVELTNKYLNKKQQRLNDIIKKGGAKAGFIQNEKTKMQQIIGNTYSQYYGHLMAIVSQNDNGIEQLLQNYQNKFAITFPNAPVEGGKSAYIAEVIFFNWVVQQRATLFQFAIAQDVFTGQSSYEEIIQEMTEDIQTYQRVATKRYTMRNYNKGMYSDACLGNFYNANCMYNKLPPQILEICSYNFKIYYKTWSRDIWNLIWVPDNGPNAIQWCVMNNFKRVGTYWVENRGRGPWIRDDDPYEPPQD